MNTFFKVLKIITVLPAVIESIYNIINSQKPQNHEKKKKKLPSGTTDETNS